MEGGGRGRCVDGDSGDGRGGIHIGAGDDPFEWIIAVCGGGGIFIPLSVEKVARDNHVSGEGLIGTGSVGESQGGDGCRG